MTHETLSRGEVLRQAWPLILANASTPLLGLADSAALGHFGTKIDLAAIALGSLIFNFLYWGLGFLRMTTTGFVAQAAGARDGQEMSNAVLRAVGLGLALGTLFFLLQAPIEGAALKLLDPGKAEGQVAGQYFFARIYGAPAALASLGGMGLLIGLGRSKTLLAIKISENLINLLLDLIFVTYFDSGAPGVGWGTAISEWLGCLLVLGLSFRLLQKQRAADTERALSRSRLFELRALRRTVAANSNILIRTLAMIAGFAFFTRTGAQFGEVVLSGNHLLLQFISLSAFFLDGFAHVAEAHVGRACGSKDALLLRQAISTTSQVAFLCAIVLALSVFWGGRPGLDALTRHHTIVEAARPHLPQVALYIFCSVAAFQLDGIFIGASATRAMRNSSLISVAVFLSCAHFFVNRYQNHGLWWSFVAFVLARGLTLGLNLPALMNTVRPSPNAPA